MNGGEYHDKKSMKRNQCFPFRETGDTNQPVKRPLMNEPQRLCLVIPPPSRFWNWLSSILVTVDLLYFKRKHRCYRDNGPWSKVRDVNHSAGEGYVLPSWWWTDEMIASDPVRIMLIIKRGLSSHQVIWIIGCRQPFYARDGIWNEFSKSCLGGTVGNLYLQ